MLNKNKLVISGEKNSEKQPWETMHMTYVGHVGEILKGGGGKLSTPGGDPGENRKPSGGGS